MPKRKPQEKLGSSRCGSRVGALVEGLAKCTSIEGMEGLLCEGDVVFVREIPNMRGHCVILRNGKTPLVGYHLDRFQILAEDEA